jgi:hypothetical protein
MNTAGAAVLPGTGRTANSSQPGKSLFAKGHWYHTLILWTGIFVLAGSRLPT